MAYYYKAGVIVPFVQKFYKQLIVVVAGLFIASMAAMSLTTRAATAGDWVLTPGSEIAFSCGGGIYEHTIDTISNEMNGDFSGTGHYNPNSGYTWNVSGNITGNSFDFTVVYTGISAGSVYNASNGVISPDGSATADVDSNCQSLSLSTGSFVEYTESEVDIYGDTGAVNEKGAWMFNRDPRTATNTQFVSGTGTLGNGSVFAGPITNSNFNGITGVNPHWDKFIAEYFAREAVANFESLAYDFKIGTVSAADANEFYVNFYITNTDATNFYNCRLDFVPSVGSTSGFTTFTVDKDTVATAFAGASCPTVKTLNNLPNGSYIRAIAINIGDTSVNDTGVSGYVDNVVYSTIAEKTTYDFEPYLRTAEITAPEVNAVVSGSVDFAAFLDDDDADGIQWAVRRGTTCNAGSGGVNNVFGNVDGLSDLAVIDQTDLSNQTFMFTGDMSGELDGEYCFVYNPREDSGESNIRETRIFVLDTHADDKSECKTLWDYGVEENGVIKSFRNQGDCVSYFATMNSAVGNNPATNGATNERANNKKNN